MSLEFEGMRPNFLEESSNLVEEESPEFRQEPAKVIRFEDNTFIMHKLESFYDRALANMLLVPKYL